MRYTVQFFLLKIWIEHLHWSKGEAGGRRIATYSHSSTRRGAGYEMEDVLAWSSVVLFELMSTGSAHRSLPNWSAQRSVNRKRTPQEYSDLYICLAGGIRDEEEEENGRQDATQPDRVRCLVLCSNYRRPSANREEQQQNIFCTFTHVNTCVTQEDVC